MKRAIALAACLVAGLLAALAITRPARAGLDCTTNTATAVAGAVLTNRGFGWSSPEHPDPLWTVDVPSLSVSYDVQAPDAVGARAAVKAILDSQLASLGCNVTTTAPTTQTTTTAPATTTAPPAPVTTTVVSTQTQTTTQTVASPPVVVFIPQPAQTVTATVTTPTPAPKVVTVKAKPAPCKPAAKKKPTKKGAR